MPNALAAATLALLLSAAAAAAQTAAEAAADPAAASDDTAADGTATAEAEPEPPQRPGAEEGSHALSDSLAECGAIMAAASQHSTSFVERDNMADASGDWFTAAAVQADAEGEAQPIEVVTEKVQAWAGKIRTVRALPELYADWLVYCDHIGRAAGIDTRLFAERLP